ncbi:MAG: SPOR domain-containing protein [Calditrichaeota bacterium]|nr:SPOR domain-containing protein [Calditrichota bacterium]
MAFFEMVARSLIFAIFLLCGSAAYSQSRHLELQQELESTRDVDAVKQKITRYIARHKGTVGALYLQALVTDDAQKSVELYKKIRVRFPHTREAENAILRIGQYYFSRGLYVSARKQFLELIETHPESELVGEAMYFSATCLCASGKEASCHAELRNFLAQFPRSPLAKMAKQDLKEMGVSTNGKPPAARTKVPKTDGKYTLQVGAFSQANNALKLRNYFSRLGVPVEIRKKSVDHRTMYLVWVGSFESKATARSFGESLKREHGKPYRIVDLN